MSRPYPDRGPRTTLPADREKWRAMNAPPPQPYGIRRALSERDDAVVDDMMTYLWESDAVSRKLDPRLGPGVTLLSRRVISRQLRRGRVIGAELGQISAAIEGSYACWRRDEPLTDVARSRIKVAGGRIVYMTLASPVLDREQSAVIAAFAAARLRPTSKDSCLPPQHVVLAQTAAGSWMSQREADRTRVAFENHMPEKFDLEPWNVYPQEAGLKSGLIAA